MGGETKDANGQEDDSYSPGLSSSAFERLQLQFNFKAFKTLSLSTTILLCGQSCIPCKKK